MPRRATSANRTPRRFPDVTEAATVEPAAISFAALAPEHRSMSSATSAFSSSPKVIVAPDDNACSAPNLSPRPTAFTNVSTNVFCRDPTLRKPATNPAVPRSR